jgi:hypothetical protein
MNSELKDLISRVKASKKPVWAVVDEFFDEICWSILKSEFDRMSDEQKLALINRLTKERK